MEEKINIAELLKDCPSGMELDCPIFKNLKFDRIDKGNGAFPIICRIKTEWGYNTHTFTEYGCYSTEKYSKCVIFPKGKTTWEGFVPPYKFKDGDVLAYTSMFTTVFIYRNKDSEPKYTTSFYVGYTMGGCYPNFHIYNKSTLIALNGDCDTRLATEEEKQKLFDVIKENGYQWNADKKKLEKLIEPKFKVGNNIKSKELKPTINTIIQVYENYYELDDGGILPLNYQDNWELVPNKFDINTLKPFESRVLVRDNKLQKWNPAIWGFYDSDCQNYPYKLIGGIALYCIPYEGNEHLLGKTDDCDEYYKNW